MIVKLKKISLNYNDFFEINGNIDLTKLKGELIISHEDAIDMFSMSLPEILFSDDIDNLLKNIYLIDENDEVYSFLNCIFSRRIGDTVKFVLNNCSMIIKNYVTSSTNNKIDTLKVKLSISRKFLYNYDFEEVSFNLSSSKKVKIKNDVIEDKILFDIEVFSSNLTDYQTMSNLLYNVVELIFLLVGIMPHTEETVAFVSGLKLNVYFDIVDKYDNKTKNRTGVSLAKIDSSTINKVILKNFINLRKETKIIFDVFLNTINRDDYIEIKNSNLIHVIEGINKSLFSKYSNSVLRDILFDYFNMSNNMKLLLSDRDKRILDQRYNTGVFIYKSVNHRNYLSHLDVKNDRTIFNGFENRYAYYKFFLSLRIFILEYIGCSCDEGKVKSIIDSIEKLAKDNKMRYRYKK